VPVGAGSPQASRGHHEGVAFGSGSEIGSDKGWVQPGQAVVVPVDGCNSIDDDHEIGSKPSSRLSDSLDIVASHRDIHEHERIGQELFLSQWGQLAEQVITIRAQPLDFLDGWCVGNIVRGKKDSEAKRWRWASVLRRSRLVFRDCRRGDMQPFTHCGSVESLAGRAPC